MKATSETRQERRTKYQFKVRSNFISYVKEIKFKHDENDQ
jgi:hypothetical protein